MYMIFDMLKMIYSSTNKRKKYVVFFDNLRSLAGITCKSFENIDDAIEFANWHSDMFMGNVDIQFMDRIKKVNHPILLGKRWDFA